MKLIRQIALTVTWSELKSSNAASLVMLAAAPRHIGQPCFDLAMRLLLTQHNSAAVIQPRDLE